MRGVVGPLGKLEEGKGVWVKKTSGLTRSSYFTRKRLVGIEKAWSRREESKN